LFDVQSKIKLSEQVDDSNAKEAYSSTCFLAHLFVSFHDQS
jgi:hypothetical protein